MKALKVLFITAVTVSVLFSCKSTGVKADKIGLNGMVYDTSNTPVVNYTVYIDGKALCVTDIGGRFYIKKITRGVHDFYGEGEGYLDIHQTITVTDQSQVLYIRIPSVEDRLNQALECLASEEFTQAQKYIEEILESDENNCDALFFKAALCLLQGNEQEAEEIFKTLKDKGGDGKYENELKKLFENQR